MKKLIGSTEPKFKAVKTYSGELIRLFFINLVLMCSLGNGYAQQDIQVQRERLSLNQGWKFHLGDIPFPVVRGHNESYNAAKAGNAPGAAAPAFDDRSWRTLNLPHDWAIEQRVDPQANVSQSYRPRGIGWYRRNFKLDPADKGKHLELQFDGVSTNCTVWINGILAHRNWSAYSSFYIDITAIAKYGDEINNVAVQVDAESLEGWWYEGAGIYRDTWLVKRSPVHIMTDGVYAHPVKDTNRQWIIPAEVTVENAGEKAADVEIEMLLRDKNGRQIASTVARTNLRPLDKSLANLKISVSNPELWSPENPALYKVITRIKQNGKVSDSVLTTCGFRTTRFDADSGFFLNNRHVKLKGVCNHEDHAGVGVAVPASINEFRIKKLKEMGVNAYRCAHNAPSKAFLNLCDSLGLMVMDENRNFNSSPEYMRQLQWLVRRDRNHPSVIMWSVFNEEPMQGTEIGYEMVRRMSAEVKKLDSTRAVTAAMNGGFFAPVNVSQAVDVVGFNYQVQSYDKFHELNPNIPMTSSEDASAYMVRGEYTTDTSRHILDAYDTQKARWGNTHREAWRLVAERPFVAGAFVWTGFDYHGEPSPFIWPTISSNFGIMDLCGFPKTAFYIHQAQWNDTKNVLHIALHWNWSADTIGKPIKVMVMSNAETVKLILNGRTIGEQKVDIYEMNTWMVPYQPGRLEAVGYKNRKEVSRFQVETTGVPVKLKLVPDRSSIAGDGRDALPVTVMAVDSKGREVPTANIPVKFTLKGSGNIIGVGNGNPNSHEPDKGNERSLFNGLAQVILQTEIEASKSLELIAEAPGIKPAKITINVRKVAPVPSVPIVPPVLVLESWRVSPVTTAKPDPNQQIDANDMNSWAPVKAGQLQNMSTGPYVVYRTIFTPYEEHQKGGAALFLKAVNGKAEVYLDGKLIASKPAAAQADLKINLPAGKGPRTLSILIEAEQGQRAGLGGVVTVQ